MSGLGGQSYIGNVPIYGDLPIAHFVGDGQQTRFELVWLPGCAQGVHVWIGGVLQTPHKAYHLESQTLVFVKPVAENLHIVVRGISHELTLGTPATGAIRIEHFATDDTTRRGILKYIIDSLNLFDDLTIALQRVFTDIGALRWSLSETPKPGWLRLDDPDQDLSKSKYNDLYQALSVLGLTQPGQDGDHFKFVDLRERFLVAPGQSLNLGDLGGQHHRVLEPRHMAALQDQNGDLIPETLGRIGKAQAGDTPENTGAFTIVNGSASWTPGFHTLYKNKNFRQTPDSFDQRPPYLTSHLHIFAGA